MKIIIKDGLQGGGYHVEIVYSSTAVYRENADSPHKIVEYLARHLRDRNERLEYLSLNEVSDESLKHFFRVVVSDYHKLAANKREIRRLNEQMERMKAAKTIDDLLKMFRDGLEGLGHRGK